MWSLYLSLQTQVRDNGQLDYSPAIMLIERRGWDVTLVLSLLQSIVSALLKAEKHEQ